MLLSIAANTTAAAAFVFFVAFLPALVGCAFIFELPAFLIRVLECVCEYLCDFV